MTTAAMTQEAEATTWVFRKEHGAWWHEAEVNGHVITVGPSIQHMWTAAMDGERIGRRRTEQDAKALAIKKASESSIGLHWEAQDACGIPAEQLASVEKESTR